MEVCMSTAGDTEGLASSKDNQKSANLLLDGDDFTLPIYEGTIGPEVIDVSRLYSETGRFPKDPGFTSTASCES